MRQFILELFIFTIVSILCFSVLGEDWKDESMVWDEEKQEWVFKPVKNKKRVKTKEKEPSFIIGSKNKKKRPGPFIYTEEWEKYLPVAVKRGNRDATDWEIQKAKRKCEVKKLSAARAQERKWQRQLKKINSQYNQSGDGLSWPMRMHVEAVHSFLRQGY